MKRSLSVVLLGLLMVLVVFSVVQAQEEQHKVVIVTSDEDVPGAMPAMSDDLCRPPMPMMMGEGKMCGHGDCPFLCCKEELELTAEQVAKLEAIKTAFKKDDIQQRAKIDVAEIELDELLRAENVDMAKVKEKVKQIEALRSDARVRIIQAKVDAKKVLTSEQLKKVKECKGMCKMEGHKCLAPPKEIKKEIKMKMGREK